MNMFCRKCGNKIDADSKFCTSCGEEVTVQTETQTNKVSNDIKAGFSFANLFNGRLGRMDFFIGGIISLVIFFMAIFIIEALFPTPSGFGDLLYWVLFIGYFVFGLSLSIRRLHDMGHSGSWVIIAFIIPFFGLYMLLADSKDADNPYGNKMGSANLVNKLLGINTE